MAPGCETPGCVGPADTLQRRNGVIEAVCYGCAGPIKITAPKADGDFMEGILEEVAVVERQETEQAKREIEEPLEPEAPKEMGRKCVECGEWLEKPGHGRKRCPNCAKAHQREYFADWRRRQAARV